MLNPQLLFLVGALGGGLSIIAKPVPLRALLVAVALGCFAIGGAEIGGAAAERAAEEKARAERVESRQ